MKNMTVSTFGRVAICAGLVATAASNGMSSGDSQEGFAAAKQLYYASRYREAEGAYRQSFADKEPTSLDAAEFGEVLMARGKYQEGCKYFNARLQAGNYKRVPLRKPWDGSVDMPFTLLVRAEHGLGDTIMYSKLLPVLKHHAPHIKIILRTQRPLKSVYSRLPYLGQ